jgi:CheY-like chemotaxis protein
MNSVSGNKNPRILLVEDNPAELRLIREIFKGFDPDCSIVSARDGVEATDILLRDDDTGFDIIILDLNLPRKNGLEVLSEIKQSKKASEIPVVVLSTSDSEIDILKSYELSANCYITKPAGLDNLIDAVKGIDNFWLAFGKRADTKAH